MRRAPRWQGAGRPTRIGGLSTPRTCSSRPARTLSGLPANLPTIAVALDHGPRSGEDHRLCSVAGSVRTIRKQKRHAFAEIGDGSTTRSLQAILEPGHAEGLTTGTFVVLRGTWRACPPGKQQTHELHATQVDILGPANAETYPLQKKFHRPDFLRTIPHLRLRTGLNGILARLRSECDFVLSARLRDHGYTRVQPPVLTTSDCEGAGEVFTVSTNTGPLPEGPRSTRHPRQEDHFRDPHYLTVSSQLHLEAYMHEYPKVWTLSPTFRAEKSDTPRHVSEFWMLELEMRTQSLDEVMDAVEDLMRHAAQVVRSTSIYEELCATDRHADEHPPDTDGDHSGMIARRWQGLMKPSWPRIPYSDAIRLLTTMATSEPDRFRFAPSWEAGIQLEHEKAIVDHVGGGGPVFVTDYPQHLKPFYMLPSTDDHSTRAPDSRTVACFDLLVPGIGEVAGGSLREHRLDPLLRSMDRTGAPSGSRIDEGDVDEDLDGSGRRRDLDWYTDLRRYGSVPHGGFGLGFDRFLGYLAGVHNIKDVIPWPRSYGRCYG